MQRKICPVCDTKLDTGNFCPVCRRWVKKPLYMNMDYYLNERHPENEGKCEYHSIPEYEKKEGRRTPDRADGHPRHTGGTAKRTAGVPNRTAGIPGGAAGMEQKKKKKGLGISFIVIAAVVIINVISILSVSVRELMEDFGKMIEAGGRRETTETVEIIDDPVTGDVRCSGFNHFPAVLEDAHSAVENWLNDNGYEIAEISTDVSNQEMRTESSTVTYYASTELFEINSNAESDGMYVEIAYDSVTEEIHSLRSVLMTREEAEALWEAAGPVLGISLNAEEIRNAEPDENEWIWTEGGGYTTLLYPAGEDGRLYGVLQPY